MSTKIIQLDHSIPVPKDGGGTVQVSEIALGRLKAKHLRIIPDKVISGKSDKINPAEMIPLIAGLADLPQESVDEMDFTDLMKVAEELVKLFEDDLSKKK